MKLTANKIYKILVVDDNEKNIQVLGNCLREGNYMLGFAMDGIQALELLKESNDYDLIILDIGMPVMDGFETCKAIRKIEDLKETPIIFITAYNDIDSIVNGFEIGGQDYITKPFNQKELMARVKTHLELKNVKDHLRDVNKWLEEKIEERTEELFQANKQLEKQTNDVLEAYLKLETANNELKQLDDSKTEFLKMISLDICAPLNNLISYLNNIKDDLIVSGNAGIITLLDKSATRLERFSFVASRLTELKNRNMDDISEFIPAVYFMEFSKDILQSKRRPGSVIYSVDENAIEDIIEGDKKLFQICFECVLDNVFRYSNYYTEAIIQLSSNSENVIFDFINNEPVFIKEVNRNLNKISTGGKYYSEQNFGIDLALIKIIMDANNGVINVRNNDAEGAVISLLFKKY
jgi:two-component system, sensor histidine kinase and response regulator